MPWRTLRSAGLALGAAACPARGSPARRSRAACARSARRCLALARARSARSRGALLERALRAAPRRCARERSRRRRSFGESCSSGSASSAGAALRAASPLAGGSSAGGSSAAAPRQRAPRRRPPRRRLLGRSLLGSGRPRRGCLRRRCLLGGLPPPGVLFGVCSSFSSFSHRLSCLQFLVSTSIPRCARDGEQPREVALRLAEPGGVLELAGRVLEAQVERLLRASLSATRRARGRSRLCTSTAFTADRPLAVHELGLDGQLVAGQAHRLAGEVLRRRRRARTSRGRA